MIQARLLIILSLAFFVSAMPNDYGVIDNVENGMELKATDRFVGPNGGICRWLGTAPFCKSSSYWTDDRCKDELSWAYTGYNRFWVEKKSKKGDGSKCWSGTKAMCCYS